MSACDIRLKCLPLGCNQQANNEGTYEYIYNIGWP